MGTCVHFMFEVDSRVKFSGEHDPVRRVLKKCAQSAFSGGATILGVEIGLFSIRWPIWVILVSMYMFSAMRN